MSALLEMRNVTAGYSTDIEILQDLSLTVERGTICGLIGLNGAGKSTVLKTVAGFLKPKSGRILFDGEDITAIAPSDLVAHEIAMIPQESSLFGYMSVRDNLLLPLRRRNQILKGRPVDERAVLAGIFERFPILREKADAHAASLSGGQQKQLEFAKVYALKPKFCMIDEPSVGLAPAVAEQIFEWIRRFAAEGVAILLVDHNLRRVIEIADYTYVLSLGRIAAEGPRASFEGDMHAQVQEWLGLAY
jgi:branched-chain amino acid transport system ATP-binding protein